MSSENTSRRRRGEGSKPFMRPNGTYQAKYRDLAGRERWVRGRTEAECRTALRKAIADRDRGLPVVSRTYRLGAWLDTWLDTIHGPTLRPRSRERYAFAVKRWSSEPIADVLVAELLPEHVAGVMGRWHKSGMGPSARSFALAVLRMALDAALVNGHAGRNVARPPFTRSVPVAPAVVEPPRDEDLVALRAAIAGDELEALWVLALDAGLRQGEALALRWRDVDERRGRVAVTGTLQYGTDEVGPTKSRRGERELPVVPEVMAALARHRARLEASGVVPHPERFVFAYADGRPLRARLVLDAWHDVCHRAGVRRYRMHDLRHAFVTEALERGLSMAMVSRYVGHSSIDMTVDKYGHLSIEAPR